MRTDEEQNGPVESTTGPPEVLKMPDLEENRGLLITPEAERAGFEPAVRFDPHAALAKRCYRPLSHLSGHRFTGNDGGLILSAHFERDNPLSEAARLKQNCLSTPPGRWKRV